jgi:hypothetical protein
VAYSSAQELFCYRRTDVDTLTEVIHRLSHLEHVEVTDGEPPPPGLARRYNIHPVRECFGARAFRERTGQAYDSMASPYGRIEHAVCTGQDNVITGLGYNFELLLRALGATGWPIKSMHIWQG